MIRSGLSATFLLVTLLPAQTVTYVDAGATGNNDGSSWSNAYTSLQMALSNAAAGEVWIARGVYRPAPANGDRASSFVLKNGLSVFGGFAGSETKRSERDPAQNPVVLSGDLNGDDGSAWTNMGDNSYNVVRCAGLGMGTVVEGITITAGRALPTTWGAGIQVTGGNLTLRNCVVERNISGWAGGIGATSAGTILLEDCRVSGNMAWLGRGAGVHIDKSGSLVLRHCHFDHNDAVGGGTTQGVGGAVYLGFTTSLEATDCVFETNTALYQFPPTTYPSEGGAICALGGSFAIDRCQFIGNQATSGGAIYTYRDGVVRNCLFDANQAIRQNDIGGNAGAIFIAGSAGLTIDGCTFYGNEGTEDVGGVWANKLKDTWITNSIFWANKDRHGTVSETSVKGGKYAYLCVQNMLVARLGEDPIDPKKFPNCTDKDPQFVDADGPDNRAGTLDDDFRLMMVSPCVDTGDLAATLRGLDVGGMPRLLDGKLDGKLALDMGAHEFANLTLRETRGATTTRIDLDGNTALLTVLFLGAEGTPLLVQPFGEFWIDLLKPMLVLPVGAIPAQLTFPLPASPLTLEAQALGFTTAMHGAVSNPIPLRF
ncbi:MAG: right-handed parallel beta-helix repeat-containing protein [Planctomycetes bacterium]|nr:right-handed parallel beta-helix repeat-containing protein [Planctomycetota bacterium]